MPITFVPQTGHVLMCDFTTGFVRPEMQKKRHCVVVSPRYRQHTGCCLVVPFSTVAPNPIEPHHYVIAADKYPFFAEGLEIWAKADMLTHAAFSRLDRVLVQGRYTSPLLDHDDLYGIQMAVLHAVGLANLAKTFCLTKG
jgi:uncharacterized protein YifN (PemK superfamily)